MKIIYSGVEYHNKKGCFSKRQSQNLYGVFYFYTPFVYEKNGKIMKGEAGDLLLSQPGEIVYHGPQNHEESFINDWLYVSKDFSKLLEKYPIPFSQNINIGKNNITNYSIRTINKEENEKKIGYEDRINCILTEMIISLYRTYINMENETSETILESVHNQIMQSLNQKWTLQEMAKLSGYSFSHFSAIYSKQYGCSPKKDLLNARLKMAEQLLVYSNCSIGEIAERCGFNSIYYFSKCFKKYFCVSPSEFVKERK